MVEAENEGTSGQSGRLLPAERAEAAALMAGAFRASPQFAYMLSSHGAATREGLLRDLFERNLELQGEAACWCARGGGEGGQLRCAFLITPGDSPPISLWRMVRVGLLRLALRWGPVATLRMMRAKAWHERALMQLLGPRPHLVLERMAVRRELRGRGIGSKSLREVLAKEADQAGLSVVLATQEERNVRFYQRLGFELALEEEYPPGTGILNWFMVRHPGRTGAGGMEGS